MSPRHPRPHHLLPFLGAVLFLAASPLLAYDRHVGADEGVLRLHLIHTNDIHGFIGAREATFMNPEFPPLLGGGASARTYVERIRREAEEAGDAVLLVDSGDIFQGTRLGEESQGMAILEWMEEMGYDAMVLGNHDFDLGWPVARRLAEAADFPVLGANIVRAGESEPVEWVEPYTIVERAGVRIALIGIGTTDTKSLTAADATEGFDFLPEDETLARYVREVRRAGAELVIGLVHTGVPPGYETAYDRVKARIADAKSGEPRRFGLNGQELAAAVPGVDVLVGGHIHWGLREPYEDPVNHTLCVQTYGRLSGVGHVILLVDRKTHTLAGYELAHHDGEEVTLFSDYIWRDPRFAEAIDARMAKAEEGMDEVVGILEVDLTRGSAEHLLGQVVADAFMEAADADVAFTNRGGIRRELRRGPVTPRDLYEVLPFGNELQLFEVTGRDLKRILETGVGGTRRDLELAGAEIEVQVTRPEGERIVRCLVGGEPLDPDRIYRVVTTTYLAEGAIGWKILTELPSEPTGISDLDALTRWFRRHSPVKRRFRPRIHRFE